MSVQDPGALFSESDAKPSMPALAGEEVILQGVMQKGQGIWHPWSFARNVSDFRRKLGTCSLVSSR